MMGPSVTEAPAKLSAHLRRDVLCAELCLYMRVIQLADEGVRPRLAGVDGHVHVVLTMPLSPLLQQVIAHHLICQFTQETTHIWHDGVTFCHKLGTFCKDKLAQDG